MNYWLKRSKLAAERCLDSTRKMASCLMSMPVYAPLCITQTSSLKVSNDIDIRKKG